MGRGLGWAEPLAEMVNDYLHRFNRGILDHLSQIIKLLDEQLIPQANCDENKIFFYKMLADYYRHTIDFQEQDNLAQYNQAVEEARINYEYAWTLAEEAKLHPTNPITLALVLNFAVQQAANAWAKGGLTN